MHTIIDKAAKFLSDPFAIAVAIGFAALLIGLAAMARGITRSIPKG